MRPIDTMTRFPVKVRIISDYVIEVDADDEDDLYERLWKMKEQELIDWAMENEPKNSRYDDVIEVGYGVPSRFFEEN